MTALQRAGSGSIEAEDFNALVDAVEQGGGGGSQPLLPVRFPFTFATPDLDAGVIAYTPDAGDALLDAWYEGTTNFDGTTPTTDLGTFDGSTTGLYKYAGNALDLAGIASATGLAGDGLVAASGNAGGLVALYAAFDYNAFPLISDGTPIKLVASQDGALGGTPIDSMAGEATLVLLMLKATP